MAMTQEPIKIGATFHMTALCLSGNIHNILPNRMVLVIVPFYTLIFSDPEDLHSYGHLPVITGYKWDYTFYKWGYKYL